MASFWPFEGELWGLWVLSRRDLNFCVRSTPLRGYFCVTTQGDNCSTSNVPAGSPSLGGDVAVPVFDVNQPTLPTPFCSLFVSISVFMALSSVFRSINSPNSLFSHFVLPVLFLPQPWYDPLWLTGLKTLTNLVLPYSSFLLSVCLWKSPSALI